MSNTSEQELQKIFTYHKPSELAKFLLENTKDNRESIKCLELIEQISMYANANISRNGLKTI
jgi:hypothetical protein